MKIRAYDEARDATTARNIAIAMLQGMDEVLSARADMLNPDTFARRRAELETKLHAERPALEPYDDTLTDEELEADLDAASAMLAIAETAGDKGAIAAAAADMRALERQLERRRYESTTHRAMFALPQSSEGFYALVELLGEDGRRRSKAVMRDRRGTAYAAERGTGLTQLERQIFEVCAFTAQGVPCLPHEVRHRRAWYSDASQIRHRWPALSADAAESLAEAFRVIGIGGIADAPQMRRIFKVMDTPAGAQRGYYYFLGLAAELLDVAPEDDEPLVDYVEDSEADEDDAPEMPMLAAEAYHLLDDPRDDDDSPVSVPWLDRPANRRTRATVERIATAQDMQSIKTIGKSLFGSTAKLDRTASSVIWGAYARRKAALTPPLSPLARRCIERLATHRDDAASRASAAELNLAIARDERDIIATLRATAQDGTLKRAAQWLHGAGKRRLPITDLAACWAAWRDARDARDTVDARLADAAARRRNELAAAAAEAVKNRLREFAQAQHIVPFILNSCAVLIDTAARAAWTRAEETFSALHFAEAEVLWTEGTEEADEAHEEALEEVWYARRDHAAAIDNVRRIIASVIRQL